MVATWKSTVLLHVAHKSRAGRRENDREAGICLIMRGLPVEDSGGILLAGRGS
jgi:hypothetical protein